MPRTEDDWGDLLARGPLEEDPGDYPVRALDALLETVGTLRSEATALVGKIDSLGGDLARLRNFLSGGE